METEYQELRMAFINHAIEVPFLMCKWINRDNPGFMSKFNEKIQKVVKEAETSESRRLIQKMILDAWKKYNKYIKDIEIRSAEQIKLITKENHERLTEMMKKELEHFVKEQDRMADELKEMVINSDRDYELDKKYRVRKFCEEYLQNFIGSVRFKAFIKENENTKIIEVLLRSYALNNKEVNRNKLDVAKNVWILLKMYKSALGEDNIGVQYMVKNLIKRRIEQLAANPDQIETFFFSECFQFIPFRTFCKRGYGHIFL